MGKLRVGVDAVGVARLERVVGGDERRQATVFTQHELTYCRGKRRCYEHMAARFAAKEAVLKAMGLGLGACGWHDIEVVRADSGAPSLRLTGAAATLADERGVQRWLVSLTHTTLLAEAIAICE